MKFLRFFFARHEEESVSRELDERERDLAEQERRLERLKHLRRERDLYDRRKGRLT